MGFFSKAVSRLEELKRQLGKEPGSRQFLALAEEYRKAGKTREMIETLEGGVSHHPTYVAGIVALGRAYHQAGRLDDALRTYLSAIKIDRENLVAIRQSAEIFLEKGDKVEAIKKLKLFRALSPGDREVAEKIEWLDADLAAARPKPGPRVDTWPAMNLPVPPPRAERPAAVPEAAPAVPRPLPPIAAAAPLPEPPRAPAEPPPPRPVEELPAAGVAPEESFAPASPAGPLERRGEQAEAPAPPPASRRAELLEMTYDLPRSERRLPEEAPQPVLETPEPPSAPPAEPIATVLLEMPEEAGGPGEAGLSVPPEVAPFEVELEIPTEALLEEEEPAEPRPPLAAVAPPSGAQGIAPPRVTETLAELYRSQGHLAEARDAYLELARLETDPARAQALAFRAAAILVPAPAPSPADRLRRMSERAAGLRMATSDLDLDSVVKRLVASSGGGIRVAVLTDLEGIPIVEAGSERGGGAQEVLVAQLTAFCKGMARTAGDVGAGRLDGLAATGGSGSFALASVAPGYALVLQGAPDYPPGRLRYEAAATADRLRPLL